MKEYEKSKQRICRVVWKIKWEHLVVAKTRLSINCKKCRFYQSFIVLSLNNIDFVLLKEFLILYWMDMIN